MDLTRAVREFWDADAPTYDDSPDHRQSSAREAAVWTAVVQRHLPEPCRVLDVGAGTGFLSLTAARLGHHVTAVDLSEGMLARLKATAHREGLAVEVQQATAEEPPEGPFDAVMERLLLWTLPDPGAALASWRRVAPGGRLLLVEGMWGPGAGYLERCRARLRHRGQHLTRSHHHHNGGYSEEMVAALPLSRNMDPDTVVDLAGAAGWR
ncbi:MAG TPA: class I SAM-dependent methyltransferase, partial [Acidimicrobiales bacterium]|nr:class I SAM-dependent methyltransferase [Acidimicrobiales bacterium]